MLSSLRNISSFYLFALAVFIISLGVIMSYLVYSTDKHLSYDAAIINEAGIIRGGIQRVTKLVLSGSDQPTTNSIKEINRLMNIFIMIDERYKDSRYDFDFVKKCCY